MKRLIFLMGFFALLSLTIAEAQTTQNTRTCKKAATSCKAKTPVSKACCSVADMQKYCNSSVGKTTSAAATENTTPVTQASFLGVLSQFNTSGCKPSPNCKPSPDCKKDGQMAESVELVENKKSIDKASFFSSLTSLPASLSALCPPGCCDISNCCTTEAKTTSSTTTVATK
ncbi:MAG: hypothetical protein AB8B69_16340 [Chitinophagales bacterium]